MSDRLERVDVSVGATADVVVFRFGDPSPLALNGTGALREVFPPFVLGASGLPVEIPGDRFVEIGFEGLYLFDDTGKPTYAGPGRLTPAGDALIAVVNVEAFEGYSTWILGFAGTGCVDLSLAGRSLTVTLGH